MTAISNDEKYENVYSDQINQIGLKNDILILLYILLNRTRYLNGFDKSIF